MGIDTAMFYGIAFGYIIYIYIYTINDVMVVSSSSKKTGATLWTKPLDPLSEAFA